ncbi:MAG: VOC family protein [Bacteroidia bacterium]|nr:VOC family protein [Bacteroidia bacterium]HQV00793.1 VOC family protein [Bacteroidia bacterium]
MLTHIHPKLPMRNLNNTKQYYINQLGFKQTGGDYNGYLMLEKDGIEIHFFEFANLNPDENYGQVYIRCSDIYTLHKHLQQKGVPMHPQSTVELKPWGQIEFALLDPDNNLLTFGQSV